MNCSIQAKYVILVNPAPDYDPENYKKFDISMGVGAHLGLLLLATVLQNAGFKTIILDGQVKDCTLELDLLLRDSSNIEFIGFSVMSSQYITAAHLSQRVKEVSPKLPVVWGGFHPTIFPEATVSNDWVDYVLVGEGDRSILQLAEFLIGKRPIYEVGNLVYKDGDDVTINFSNPLSDFTELPLLQWEIIGDIEPYIRKRNALGEKTRFINILVGLGCNYRCSFCHNAINKRKHRTRNATSIIEEMVTLHNKYNISEFGLVDENFFDDRKRLFEFLDLLEMLPFKVRWTGTLRANFVNEHYLNRELLKRIYRLGGYYFGVGAESGDEEILKKLNKAISIQHIINVAEITKDTGIIVTLSFIAGIPGEDCSTTLKTFRLIERLKTINPEVMIIGPQIFRPYPGSPLYNEAIQMGFRPIDDWNNPDKFLKILSQFRKIDIEDVPWMKEAGKFKYMMLSFYSLQINRRNNRILNAVLDVLKVIAQFRLNTGFYTFFVERFVLNYINRKLV